MMMMNEVRAELFLRRLPQEVRASLTPAQEMALRQAAAGRSADPHPIDIRLSVPTPWGRYYFALFGGREKRSAARRASDRRLRPLATTANVLFFGGALGVMCLMLLIGLLLAGAVLEI
jgi:hypothetical protein